MGNWSAAATNDTVRYTPGAANSVRATLAPFPAVWINEVLAESLNSATDPLGEHDPWIELYNSGTNTEDLAGLYLSPSATNLTAWQFPSGAVIQPGQFLLVWADGQPEQSGAGAWHTGFRLTPGTGAIALSRPQNGAPAVINYLHYTALAADRSFGPFSDGQPKGHQVFAYPTPGGANNPASMPVNVRINEWMASNTKTLMDPLTQRYDDWFELYNAGSTVVDLTDYTLTDTLTNATQFVIPAGTAIPAGGYLLVWADQQGNDPTNQELHANFKLSQSGEAIGLFAPDGTVVDSVVFGPQTNDVSQGRYPDGAAGPFVYMEMPTPGTPNFTGVGNRPPRVDALPRQLVYEGGTLSLTVTASDPDSGQTVTFGLDAGAPAWAVINPNSGVFTWTPAENQGPGEYAVSVRVSDDGTPSLSATQTFQITVVESNRPPVLAGIPDQTVIAGTPLALNLSATDPDMPANKLTYFFDGAVPDGMSVEPNSGRLAWTPLEAQAPSTNRIAVRVSDNGTPSMSDTQSFNVIVKEPSAWQYVSATGTASSSTFYIYLTAPGDVYLDDIQIVAGSTAEAGPNVLPNGDFEKALTNPWTVSANHAGSAIVSNVFHSGKSSLHLVASSGGTTRASSIWQDIAPALTPNADYTLSFWYLPGASSNALVLRLSGSGISTTNTVVPPPQPAAIDISGISKEGGDRFRVTWASVMGARYQLQSATQLPSSVWNNVGEIVTATSGTATQTDPSGDSRQKFYRILKVD
jgi:hypothetical protein